MAQEKQAEKKEQEVKRFYEPECPSTLPVYDWRVDEEGHHILVQTGERNFDDEIQLYKDQCDIKIIIDRLTKRDPAVIAQLTAEQVYGDVNNFPEEYHPRAGAQALHRLYENQPDEIKQKFPTYELFEKYFTTLTEGMIAQMFAPKKEENPKEEVKDE